MFLNKLKSKIRYGLLAVLTVAGLGGVLLTQNLAQASAQNITVNGQSRAINTNPSGPGWSVQGGALTLNNFNGQSIEVDGAINITLVGDNVITQKLRIDGGKAIISAVGNSTLTVDHQQQAHNAAYFSHGLLMESGTFKITNRNFQTEIDPNYAALLVNSGGLEIAEGAVVEADVLVPAGKNSKQRAMSISGLLKVNGKATAKVDFNTSIAGEIHAIKLFANLEVGANGELQAQAPDKALDLAVSSEITLNGGVRIVEPVGSTVSPDKHSILPRMPSKLLIKNVPVVKHAITKAAMTNGDVQISVNSAAAGEEVTVAPQPDDGYQVKTLTYKPEGESAQVIVGNKFTMPDKSVEVAAEFELKSYHVTAEVINGIGGQIIIKPAKNNFKHGERYSVEITADSGYVIKQILIDTFEVDNYNGQTSALIAINSAARDAVYKVEFEPIPVVNYTLTINCGLGGDCNPAGTTQRLANSKVNLILTPNLGYRVKAVTGAAIKLTDLQYQITMDTSKTIDVEFEPIPVVKYQLTVNCGQGGACSPTGTSQQSENAVVTITVTPDSNKRVKSVTGATKRNETTYEVVMNSAKTVTVEFEAIPAVPMTYNITKGAMIHGDVEISKAQAAKDEEIVVVAKPEQGYKLKKLTYTPAGDSAVDITTALKFNMPEKAVEINAEFELITFVLTIDCGMGGTCIPSAPGPHLYGTEVTIALTPEANKQVKVVNGATKVTDTTYKVVMDAAKTVSVEFEDKASTPLAPAPAIEVDKPAIKQDEEITVSVDNLTAYEGQELEVWLHSNPKLVGKFTVLAGKASLKFKIPCDVAAGAHTIYVKSGNTNVLSQAITVATGNTCVKTPGAPNTGYRPGQVSVVAIIAGLASLAGVVIAIKKRA